MPPSDAIGNQLRIPGRARPPLQPPVLGMTPSKVGGNMRIASTACLFTLDIIVKASSFDPSRFLQVRRVLAAPFSK